MENIFCIECGFELPATAKFCKKCGIQIESAEAATEVVTEITKKETIESKSKPVTQAPIKATPSKAMAIGTTLLEWIIIFVVGGVVSLIGLVLFGAAGGSIMGFAGWLIARATMRSILKSILPLRYEAEEDIKEEKVEVEVEEVKEEKEVEVLTEEDKEKKSEYDPSSAEAAWEAIGISMLIVFGLIVFLVIVSEIAN